MCVFFFSCVYIVEKDPRFFVLKSSTTLHARRGSRYILYQAPKTESRNQPIPMWEPWIESKTSNRSIRNRNPCKIKSVNIRPKYSLKIITRKLSFENRAGVYDLLYYTLIIIAIGYNGSRNFVTLPSIVYAIGKILNTGIENETEIFIFQEPKPEPLFRFGSSVWFTVWFFCCVRYMRAISFTGVLSPHTHIILFIFMNTHKFFFFFIKSNSYTKIVIFFFCVIFLMCIAYCIFEGKHTCIGQ